MESKISEKDVDDVYRVVTRFTAFIIENNIPHRHAMAAMETLLTLGKAEMAVRRGEQLVDKALQDYVSTAIKNFKQNIN